jgi:DNA-binding MarR family transcriptional regulator
MGVASNPPDDTELELLLTRLLRIVSPAVTAEAGQGPSGSAPSGGPRPSAGLAHSAADAGAARAGSSGYDAAGGAPQAGAPQHDEAAGGSLPAISASEARALIELVSARGIAQGELGSLLGLEKSTVSRLAAGLERKGWVRRGRDTDNQRYVRLYLTAEGRDVAGRVWQAWHSRQARILAALSDEERSGLSSGLRGLVRGLAAEGLLGETAAPGSG